MAGLTQAAGWAGGGGCGLGRRRWLGWAGGGGCGLGRRRWLNQSTPSPVDPFEGGELELDRFEGAPGAAAMVTAALERPLMVSVSALSAASALSALSPTLPTEGSMPAAASRPVYQPPGIFDRDGLHTATAVVDAAATADGPALVEGLRQRVPHKAGVSRARNTPDDTAPGKGVDDNGDDDKASPRRDTGPAHVATPVQPTSRHRSSPRRDTGKAHVATPVKSDTPGHSGAAP
jgi:hypothetical protein